MSIVTRNTAPAEGPAHSTSTVTGPPSLVCATMAASLVAGADDEHPATTSAMAADRAAIETRVLMDRTLALAAEDRMSHV